MNDQEYLEKLNEYTQRIDSLNKQERSAYLREDYTEEEYEWEEYLDYCEDWNYQFNKIADRHLMNFSLELAKRKTKITCGDHTHELRYHEPREPISKTQTKGENKYIVISSTTSPPRHECWFQTIEAAIKQISTECDAPHNAARLPPIMLKVFQTLIKCGLTQQNLSYELVPYDVFTSGLWDKGSRMAFNDLKEGQTVKSLLHQLNHDKVTENEDNLLKEKHTKWLLLSKNDVTNSHGFHTFLKTAGDESKWLQFINRFRRQAKDFSSPNENITLADVREKEETCEKCKWNKGKRQFTNFGVYYAPPGNGKTTLMNDELFLGFDTDWITSGLQWTQLTKLFMANIPILTNQYSAFQNSGLLITGIFNEKHVRLRPSGQPFTTWEEVKLRQTSENNFLVLHQNKNQYLNRSILCLSFLNFIREVSLIRFMKKRRFKHDEYWKHSEP